MSTQYRTHAKWWWGIAGEARRERTLWPRVFATFWTFFSLKSYWMSETMGVREGKERNAGWHIENFKFQTPPPPLHWPLLLVLNPPPPPPPCWGLTLIPGSTLAPTVQMVLSGSSMVPQFYTSQHLFMTQFLAELIFFFNIACNCKTLHFFTKHIESLKHLTIFFLIFASLFFAIINRKT